MIQSVNGWPLTNTISVWFAAIWSLIRSCWLGYIYYFKDTV